MTTNDRTAIINDRYEIFRRIGRGGMADVFLGRDRLLDRQVAVKVLFPEFAVDPNFVERFRREAEAAAKLVHPHICAILDYGSTDEVVFTVMPYLGGGSLADSIQKTRTVDPVRTASVAAQIACAANKQGKYTPVKVALWETLFKMENNRPAMKSENANLDAMKKVYKLEEPPAVVEKTTVEKK